MGLAARWISIPLPYQLRLALRVPHILSYYHYPSECSAHASFSEARLHGNTALTFWRFFSGCGPDVQDHASSLAQALLVVWIWPKSRRYSPRRGRGVESAICPTNSSSARRPARPSGAESRQRQSPTAPVWRAGKPLSPPALLRG